MTWGSPATAAWCKELHPLLSSQEAAAPFSRNRFTACSLLFAAANIRGVSPSRDLESMSSTWVWMREMTSESPPSAAKCKEFHPLLSSQVAAAPFSRNHITACSLPVTAANISGVRPWVDLTSMFGTWVWMREMIPVSPPTAAKCSELSPVLSIRDGSAPPLIKLFTPWKLPSSTASISGVLPVASLEFTDNRKGSVDFILVTSPPLSSECTWYIFLLSLLTEVAPKIAKFEKKLGQHNTRLK